MEAASSLLNALYDDRKNYTIVALTGYTGTGCTQLANLMSKEFSKWDNLRLPKNLLISKPNDLENDDLYYEHKTNHTSISESIFARKYAICYNFAENHYIRFDIIKYSKVLLLFCCKYWVEIQGQKGPLKDFIINILKDKYRPSRSSTDNEYRQIRSSDHTKKSFDFDSEQNNIYPWSKVRDLTGFSFKDWDNLQKDIESAIANLNNESQDLTTIGALFFEKESSFNKFSNSLIDYLWETDPYCADFFFHRLGYVLRATGNPLKKSVDVYNSTSYDGKNIYSVVTLINTLIKAYRKYYKEKPCRLVIDKIRNSLEAKFLKERYSAFYFIALHEGKEVRVHLETRLKRIYPTEDLVVANTNLISAQIDYICKLDSKEREGKDFENGKFYAQNISQCVADAEIHISNETEMGHNKPMFFSMSEQWMKYAALIQHPGLITPSSEERCMVVAYTAKYNSGCLSRQVGAVITNKAHTIRSIGWNDVPYGQIPCSLRELKVMATGQNDDLKTRQYFYSRYETEGLKTFKDGKSFNEKVKLKYANLHIDAPNSLMDGFPNPYCFKSLQNEFEDEKNQVHTRSLHAEENAILQMAKYGGEALLDGIIYVTASPCELCCKKLYQIGVRKIVFIDEYPGISRENIIGNGFHRPKLKQFQGAYGPTYFKLYQPLISYKEELKIRNRKNEVVKKNNFQQHLYSKILSLIEGVRIDSEETEAKIVKEFKKILDSAKVKSEKTLLTEQGASDDSIKNNKDKNLKNDVNHS